MDFQLVNANTMYEVGTIPTRDLAATEVARALRNAAEAHAAIATLLPPLSKHAFEAQDHAR